MEAEGFSIQNMVDEAWSISRKTFLKYVDKDSLKALEKRLGYSSHWKQGMTMASDWHVSYCRSKFRGVPCVYVSWSCIEYIFTSR